MKQTTSSLLSHSLFIILLLLPCTALFAQTAGSASPSDSGLRASPVTYHLSFDDTGFLQEEFIEPSGRLTLEQRGIEFPEGRFGNAIRMNRIPDPPDAHNMTGIDLDLIVAAMFNARPNNTMGYTQPMIWGTGRLNGRLGSVAFWARGETPFHGLLFEQTSVAFGRTERDLLGVFLTREGHLAAYLRDARYERHEIRSGVEWNPDRWNHIVLNWDWANGLELWLNGERIASDHGQGGWFDTAPVGLFHLPMPSILYDELWLMDRPLSQREIRTLMRDNTPPGEEEPLYRRAQTDTGRIDRISGAQAPGLPAVRPGQNAYFTEVWPDFAGDGNIPGWYVIDGRNEMAWPHPYGFFTVIPGDADFHAEQVEIHTPAGLPVNYVTLTGNLTDVRLQTLSEETGPAEQFRVPDGNGFFYGSMITPTTGSTFRIPFRESYGDPVHYSFEGATYRIPYNEEFGDPDQFAGDVLLPVSGEKRIQNVGLYHFRSGPGGGTDGERLTLQLTDNPVLDERSRFKIHAVTSRDERNFAVAGEGSGQEAGSVDIGAFSRLHILSRPYEEPTGVTDLTLSLPLRTARSSETLFVRVHDPALPQRLWNDFAVRLDGFDRGGTLELTIDMHDLVLSGGDRLWVSLATSGPADLLIGDAERPAQLAVGSVDAWQVADDWADKQLISTRAQYAKMYGYMPWKFDRRFPSLESPVALGGPYDMILPALAVERVLPDHFVANFFTLMSGENFQGGHPVNPENFVERVTLDNPHGAPDWALYMRDFNRKRHAIIDWWLAHQNPDGQIGGGWNDDTLFMIAGLKDILFDSEPNARLLHDAIHTGFEHTHVYRNGFCNLYPMDRMHDADFISERYNTVIHNLGQPHAAEREMESAWRLGKPEQTPVNYSEGLPFHTAVNTFEWWWGTAEPADAYRSEPLDELAEQFRLYTSVLDDHYFFNLTEAWVHTTSQAPHGSRNMYGLMLGGEHGPRWNARPDLAVKWPSGGGPDVARIILSADDTSLEAVAYSFRDRSEPLDMRLMRIRDGHYRISIHADPQGTGQAGRTLWSTEKDLVRFDTISLPLPTRTPVVIRLEQLREHQRPARLPDLAINPWGAVMHGSTIQVTIHNLGNAPAENVSVQLFNGDRLLQEKQIERIGAPEDFVPRRAQIVFNNIPAAMDRKNLSVVIDPDNRIREILTDNNRAPVTLPSLAAPLACERCALLP